MPRELLETIVSGIPCLSLTAGKISVNTSQIVQAVIGAVIIALLTSFIMVQRMEVTLGYIVDRLEDIEVEVKAIKNDFYKPHTGGHE